MAKRGKIPSLISGVNGRPNLVRAQRKRTCSRCGGEILSGEQLFEIPKSQSGFNSPKPFCLTCFDDVLRQTQKDLDELCSLRATV